MAADPYVDPATGVLHNRLGLTDELTLQVAEAGIARLHAASAVAYADNVRYLNEAALKRIHRIVFDDIYEWAGEFRSIHLSKAEGGLPFAAPDRLAGAMQRRIMPAFHKLARRAGGDDRVLVDALAQCWGELNELHPFREGNGRATQIFIGALARRYDRDIDWSKITHAAERDAAIASMQRDFTAYSLLLRIALEPWSPGQAPSAVWIAREHE